MPHYCFYDSAWHRVPAEKRRPYDKQDEELLYLRQKIFAGLGIPDGTLLGRPASHIGALALDEDAQWLEQSLRKILSKDALARIEHMLKQYTHTKEAVHAYRMSEAYARPYMTQEGTGEDAKEEEEGTRNYRFCCKNCSPKEPFEEISRGSIIGTRPCEMCGIQVKHPEDAWHWVPKEMMPKKENTAVIEGMLTWGGKGDKSMILWTDDKEKEGLLIDAIVPAHLVGKKIRVTIEEL